MLLPNDFKETIAETFYDKDINIHEKIETQDAEGGRKKVAGDLITTFKGNVRYTNLKEIQEEYGLTYQIDIAITTHYEDISVDDLIKYKDVTYVVTDAIPNDSHIFIVGVKFGKSTN